jgi:quercetin dioxygenase-like cupin family protein
MAYKNKVINNSKTGQSIWFMQTAKDTDGKLLEMESTFAPHSKEPPPHYHPLQDEDFKVIKGTITVKINEEQKNLKQGDQLHIPANTVHSMWNASEEITIVNWKVQPALNTEALFETVTGLANDGKTNENGLPGFLQAALLMNKYSAVYRPASPSYVIQKIVFGLAAPVAWLFGLKAVYNKYLD